MKEEYYLSDYKLFNDKLQDIPEGKVLISTLNAFCYTIARKDAEYAEALDKSQILIPDGVGVIFGIYFLTGRKLKKIAGADLFYYEMSRLNSSGGSCFFLGSAERTLQKVKDRAASDFPNVRVHTYSPPFKSVFSHEDNDEMLLRINECNPDVLFVGMTAPKQEKWAYKNFELLQTKHICCIGAVFDFYAGNIGRAPKILINLGLEWLYRLLKEPQRLWKRYLIGNSVFIWLVIKEKFKIIGK